MINEFCSEIFGCSHFCVKPWLSKLVSVRAALPPMWASQVCGKTH